jgi:hypothetical protein
MPKSSSPSFGEKPRASRRFHSGAPYLVPLLLSAAAAYGGWRLYHADITPPALLTSPETQVKTALAHQTRAHLEDIYGFMSGGTLELHQVTFKDVVVAVEGEKATVTAMLDAEGLAVWREERATVSYLGREQFHLHRCDIALWCAEGDQFQRLRQVLHVLFRRHDAFNGRDPGLYARILSEGYPDRAALLARLRRDLAAEPPAKAHILAWQIRVERESAEAGEDYQLAIGEKPPVKLRARYQLKRENERWYLSGGVG